MLDVYVATSGVFRPVRFLSVSSLSIIDCYRTHRAPFALCTRLFLALSHSSFKHSCCLLTARYHAKRTHIRRAPSRSCIAPHSIARRLRTSIYTLLHSLAPSLLLLPASLRFSPKSATPEKERKRKEDKERSRDDPPRQTCSPTEPQRTPVAVAMDIDAESCVKDWDDLARDYKELEVRERKRSVRSGLDERTSRVSRRG